MITQMKLPNSYCLTENTINHGTSSMDIYSVEVSKQLHPPTDQSSAIVKAYVLVNPIPQDFTDNSLKLLTLIKESDNDELLKTKPIQLVLARKWEMFTSTFYQIQFFAFVAILISLTILFTVDNIDNEVIYVIACVPFIFNSGFTIYELFQMIIQKMAYFTDIWNLLD